MSEKTLYRSRESMIGGVCAGLANYLNVDKSLVRIAFALFTLAAFTGLWVYLIMWLVVPLEKLDF